MSEANDAEKDGEIQERDSAPSSESDGAAKARSDAPEAKSDAPEAKSDDAKSDAPEAKSDAPEAKSDDAKSDDAKSDDAAETTSETAAAPVRKKKKKKKKKPGSVAESDTPAKKEGPEYDVSGAERAAFLAWFPEDPELDQLVRAFEVGNYAYVREHAGKLAEKSDDEKVRAAARELLARIEPDPLMKFLLLGAIALLVFLTIFAYRSHGH